MNSGVKQVVRDETGQISRVIESSGPACSIEIAPDVAGYAALIQLKTGAFLAVLESYGDICERLASGAEYIACTTADNLNRAQPHLILRTDIMNVTGIDTNNLPDEPTATETTDRDHIPTAIQVETTVKDHSGPQ